MALKLLRPPSLGPPGAPLPPLTVDSDFLYRIPLAPAQVFTALRGAQTLSDTEEVLSGWPLADQALLVASPTLERERRRGTLRPKAERQMQRSLHRYLIRASTRSLPFGLFAATGSASCAAATPPGIRPALDVSISALSGAVQQARSVVEAALPPDLRCCLNPTAQWKNGTLSWQALTDPAERCCPCSPALHGVLQACREPVELARLLEQLNPPLIRALLSTDVLLSEFQPLLTVSPEHEARLARFSQQVLGSDVTQAALRQAYSQADSVQQLDLLRSVLTPAAVPDGTVQRTLALDAILTGCVAVPSDVRTTVLEGVLALRGSPVPPHLNAALNDFQNAWSDRFGTDFGPFGTALALWQQTEERAASPERRPHADPVDARWTTLLDELDEPSAHSLCLTDDLLTSLPNTPHGWPDEFDVLGWLLAADLGALGRGEYRVALLGEARQQRARQVHASGPVIRVYRVRCSTRDPGTF
ncbi:lantibiotic dehydratase [Deinococcus sp. KNUC1210]|uniref:lantibiotic dehydratase n=1 Tax=Deinococcus sp. KNUC1210 TaxID=2917691 RepID=UPI0021032799|nr:lantibiotic dehydratase [Deinococcus sp. KNUC1210]